MPDLTSGVLGPAAKVLLCAKCEQKGTSTCNWAHSKPAIYGMASNQSVSFPRLTSSLIMILGCAPCGEAEDKAISVGQVVHIKDRHIGLGRCVHLSQDFV